MRSQECIRITNVSATPAAFSLVGGKYDVSVMATWGGGSAKLQQYLPDGTTLIDVGSTTNFSANGHAVVDLPPGSYVLTIATATGVSATVTRVPEE